MHIAKTIPSWMPTRLDKRVDRVLDLLLDHRTVVVSGTKIAQEIGTSGKQVWPMIQRLRRLGVIITGRPGTGYALAASPDLLLPSVLAPPLRGTIFDAGLHHYYKVLSTNLLAMQAASAGAKEGSVFLSEEQTAGRGRAGHSWYSARGLGIYCSVVLRPVLSPADSLLISLAAGLAVHAAVEQVKPESTHLQLDLKWPNDVLVGGKKFCGILTEMNAEVTRVRHLVVGIGINVNHQRFPDKLAAEATSLRLAAGRNWSRVDVTLALLKSLHREYQQLRSGGRDRVLRRFSSLSAMIRGVRVSVEDNGSSIQGITAGLDARGFLQLRTDQGLATVLSGTVRPLTL
ncbi:MAG: biotin--[acetyl-CoA-carboxylase] ligase [Acidobacteria bacterium]|nr:biotin--[acetyl-CoA-carboxylase] ligase [Acidobacteriota bacterium]